MSDDGISAPARQACASPPPQPVFNAEDLASDALCHMEAALAVLKVHAQQCQYPDVHGARDLLRSYYDTAYGHMNNEPLPDMEAVVLPRMSSDLDRAVGILQRVNGDDRDDLMLHAVNHLLRAARRHLQRQA
ncbi:hypothetical protein MI467_23705 [Delftia acidovorans]|uniref:hypothetical protein n=1 Tax=Delftia acidovorans TaxID=80866 RepID=UPI001EFD9AF6|nr:hypothetical protein [Delftia acidovorans]MCG8989858.1 hypothetical protein [Delftia acidovorans]